ncbi:MAG: SET domain-containing protein-lysine N-methyltransferase [Chloroflexi bacterium]|nr:SET domain-containing protein-lysine N-methyltransferase [Chloroflexota bacterium]
MTRKSASYLSEKLEARENEAKGGWGLFARQPVNAGELLLYWGGTIIDYAELMTLPEDVRIHTIQVEEDLFQKPIFEDDPADMINHSCDPNAGLATAISVVAMRDIRAGEEVCFDYATCDSQPYDEFNCQCGAPNCRQRVTGDDWKKPELWARYNGYFSPYLQRRINELVAVQMERIPVEVAAG